MNTNWNLIRQLLNTAIDTCEAIDDLGITEHDRCRLVELPGTGAVSVSDFLQSAWIYPENLSYSMVRARHKLGNDKAFTPESARIITNVARLCAELVDMKDTKTAVSGVDPNILDRSGSIEEMAADLINWYKSHMVPSLKEAMGKGLGS